MVALCLIKPLLARQSGLFRLILWVHQFSEKNLTKRRTVLPDTNWGEFQAETPYCFESWIKLTALLCAWDKGSPGGKLLSGRCVEGGGALVGLGGGGGRQGSPKSLLLNAIRGVIDAFRKTHAVKQSAVPRGEVRSCCTWCPVPCPGPALRGPPHSKEWWKQVGTNCWAGPW